MTTRRSLLAFVTIALLPVLSVDAATPHQRFLLPSIADRVEAHLPKELSERLRALSTNASEGDWQFVAREAARLGDALVRRSHTDPAPYAIISAYRGIAAAALGKEQDARWYWTVALNLMPDVNRKELASAYDTAPALLSVSLPPPHPSPKCPQADQKVKSRGNRVHPILFGPFDRSRRAAHGFWAEATIGKDGSLHSPRLLMPAVDTGGDIAYGGLEAMRDAKFVPARSKGEPVECPFGILMSFRR